LKLILIRRSPEGVSKDELSLELILRDAGYAGSSG